MAIGRYRWDFSERLEARPAGGEPRRIRPKDPPRDGERGGNAVATRPGKRGEAHFSCEACEKQAKIN